MLRARTWSPSLTAVALWGVLWAWNGVPAASLGAQQGAPPADAQDEALKEEPPAVEPPPQVDVNPEAVDADIAARLERILRATGWFDEPRATVTEGVVFLEGTASTDEHRQWATALARNTEDVVATANRMAVRQSSPWDFSPAWSELREMRRNAVQALPTVSFSLLLLGMTYLAAKGAAALARRVVARRTENRLLREVLTKAIMIPVAVVGCYLALRVTGLTRLAATVLGGTGVAGLVIGIAFRDIAENFLASLLISTQRPFQAGDTITVDGRTGLVLAVTTRGTTIMAPEGNHVRIPNSTIYKSTIVNLTANPKQRGEFTAPVDARQSLVDAQEAILHVLREHEAVLHDPEPMVLVDRLGHTVSLCKALFWVDGHRYSKDKVRSALIRLAKLALDELPVDAKQTGSESRRPAPAGRSGNGEDRSPVTQAEGALRNEAGDIQEQAQQARPVQEGPDLLTAPK